MPKFRKKPVVIEAMQWDGTFDSAHSICRWSRSGLSLDANAPVQFNDLELAVQTLEGRMTVSPQDYVIRGVKGEFYPCKEVIFLETYEPVEDLSDVPNGEVAR